jgi:hypothetical protein
MSEYILASTDGSHVHVSKSFIEGSSTLKGALLAAGTSSTAKEPIPVPFPLSGLALAAHAHEDKFGQSEMSHDQARAMSSLGDFLGSPSLIPIASYALRSIWHALFTVGSDSADQILSLMDQGTHFPMNVIEGRRERVPLSAWNPESLRSVVEAVCKAPVLSCEAKQSRKSPKFLSSKPLKWIERRR